jgi:transposase InsO family protein
LANGDLINHPACHGQPFKFLFAENSVHDPLRSHYAQTSPGQYLLETSGFLPMGDARARIEEWRCDYNQNRPHSSLGGLTPAEFAGQLKTARKVA